MTEVFKLHGKYPASSDIPYITIPNEGSIERSAFWQRTIAAEVAKLSDTQGLDAPVYIATGGGYGANDTLIEVLKGQGKIVSSIPSIQGEPFRTLPAFEAEKPEIRWQIAQHLGKEEDDPAVEAVLRSFYSDEVNTKLAKEVVKAAIRQRKPVIHESASIYPDTVERAELAKEHGIKTILIAGDRDHVAAIEAKQGETNKFNTAVSYKRFAARFEEELVPLFDEIQLYKTDTDPPTLIAQKLGANEALEILDQELYAAFINRQHIDPNRYKTPDTLASVISAEHIENQPAKDGPGRQ